MTSLKERIDFFKQGIEKDKRQFTARFDSALAYALQEKLEALEIIQAQQEIIEMQRDFIEKFDVEPYPEFAFEPLTKEQFKSVVEHCEKSGFSIDRLSADYYRPMYANWRKEALKILDKTNKLLGE